MPPVHPRQAPSSSLIRLSVSLQRATFTARAAGQTYLAGSRRLSVSGNGSAHGGSIAALLDPGRLTAQVAQVVELGPADTAVRDQLDLVDRGAVHGEGTLDAHAIA